MACVDGIGGKYTNCDQMNSSMYYLTSFSSIILNEISNKEGVFSTTKNFHKYDDINNNTTVLSKQHNTGTPRKSNILFFQVSDERSLLGYGRGGVREYVLITAYYASSS